ncbi:BglG family transcription antiterminator LicT [Anaeromicropila herbilytica]|uniref:Transcription antiterminator LicT n=1 Tax=Anaeromicropila herbilytica TaxID=2785025 RepID=A0A7R7IFV5_9FIRM|nr:PRD domain-containing protein [Anaeromicropila herbilytica]BCN32468.1 transcription antiterminator LicT [Anaeromicropila herbilytica]
MKISKVINNNVITTFDEHNNEIVIMGCGIGFRKNPKDEVDETKIEKIFSMSNSNTTKQFQTLLEKIPLEIIRTANEIIAYAKCSLTKELSDSIYVALTDHLNFAVERCKKQINFKNALLWEIKRFYNHEYLIAKEAIAIIDRNLGIQMNEDEVGFIALHIVNAELNTDMEHSLAMTKMIQDILNIIKYHYQVQVDENTLHYERFITHLKFFVERAFRNNYYQTEDIEFCKMIQKQYTQAYQCSIKIAEYMKSKINYELTEEELSYLTIHIKRITTDMK